MAIPSIPDIRTLMEAGVHFGHASGRWHPKMKPFIFATRDKLHIINLEVTQEKMAETLQVLHDRIAAGKVVVLVGTKKQVSDEIKAIGERLNIPYVNVRWPGGVMTNFVEIQKSITRMKKTEEFLASENVGKMIKKERVMLESELRRMLFKFGGLRSMNKKPDALFIIDPSHERIAVKEAKNQGVELFGVVDTNCNPSEMDFVIPANDDGPKSIKLVLSLIEETIANAQKAIPASAPAPEKEAKTETVVAESAEATVETAK